MTGDREGTTKSARKLAILLVKMNPFRFSVCLLLFSLAIL